MKTVILPKYNKNIIRALLSLEIEEREIRKPSAEEVVIKMYAAPINPSDIAFMQGGYNIIKPLPAVPGFEGAGIVVDAGQNLKHLIGKKVSCFVQNDNDGTWSEYLTTGKNNIIVLEKEMDMEQAACFTVNPFTALGLFKELDDQDGNAVIITAAGSQVAELMRGILRNKGITAINIVRSEKTAKKLMSEGNRHVFLETDENLTKKIKSLNNGIKIKGAVDAVGGSLTGIIFNSIPENTPLILYGGLSNKPVSGLDNLRIIFNKNKIYGFNLPEWFEKQRTKGDFDNISKNLQDLFISGKLKTKIKNNISIDNLVKGIRSYISDMSGGKVLIKF